MSESLDIVCVGDCGVDRYEAAGQVPTERPGGCTLNFAVNLKRNLRDLQSRDVHDRQVNVKVVTGLGDDPGGRLVAEVLAKESLESLVQTISGTTPVQKLTVEASGERRFTGYDAGVLPALKFNSEQLTAIEEANLVVSVIYSQILPLVTRLLEVRRRGDLALDFMTMGDFGYSLAPIEDPLRACRFAFFGLKSDQSALIREIAEFTRSTSLTAVVTCGGDPGMAWRRGEATHFRPVPVPRVLDTTGAGDVFAAGFISQMLMERTLEEALSFAAEKAAAKVQRFGAF